MYNLKILIIFATAVSIKNRERMRKREKGRERERDRQRQKDRDRETETERQREKERERETEKKITCRKKSTRHSKYDTSNDVLPTESKGSNVDETVNNYHDQSTNPFLVGFSS